MSEINNHIQNLLNKADHDLGSAKLIYMHIPDYFDTIAFHCQQAVEKYIKSILVFFYLEFQRSHDLVYLLDLLSRRIEIDEEIYNRAITLNGFSIEVRYSDKKMYLTKEELEYAIKVAEDFRAFAFKIIGIEENNISK